MTCLEYGQTQRHRERRVETELRLLRLDAGAPSNACWSSSLGCSTRPSGELEIAPLGDQQLSMDLSLLVIYSMDFIALKQQIERERESVGAAV